MKKLIISLIFLIVPLSVFADQLSVGVVSDVENEAQIISQGKEKKISIGMFVEKGSKIVTGKVSRVKIMMMDDSLLVIAPNSEFLIDDYVVDMEKKSRKSLLGVIRGKVLFYVNKAFSKSDSRFEVKTKSSIAGVRGTKFIVESGEKEFIGVISGEVLLKTTDKELTLSGGKCADSSKGFELADIDQQALQDYTESFQIKKGKTQVAMLERGTGLTGEALLESSIKNGALERVLTKEVGERVGGEKKAEAGTGIREGGDYWDSLGETTDSKSKNGGSDITDVISGSKSLLRIKILLPFAKVRR